MFDVDRESCRCHHYRLPPGCLLGLALLTDFWAYNFPGPRNHDIVVHSAIGFLARSSLKYPPPPSRRVQGSRVVVKRWIYIIEKVPRVSNHHSHNLVSWYIPVHHKTESHQNPRKVWCRKHHETEEAQPSVRVSPRPDIHKCRGQRRTEKRHGDERRHCNQANHGVDKQP